MPSGIRTLPRLRFWIKPAEFGGNGYLISKHGWNVYIAADGIARFETRTADDSAWRTLPAGRALTAGVWQLAAAVFDPESQRESMYLDGELSAESPRTDGAIGATAAFPLQLGRYTVSNTQNLRGELDEVRVYGRALAAGEFGQLTKSSCRWSVLSDRAVFRSC